jgi:hypothetical protein
MIYYSGYELGDMFQSKTKGIWVWCKMHPKMTDTVLLLLDTEDLKCLKRVCMFC